INANGETESYFSPPTKKITVSLYQNKKTKSIMLLINIQKRKLTIKPKKMKCIGKS
ncbi:hypothetical protein LCGC14_2512900, partial [marine sediment metagenome]